MKNWKKNKKREKINRLCYSKFYTAVNWFAWNCPRGCVLCFCSRDSVCVCMPVCVYNILCLHEPYTRKSPSHASWGQVRTPWGAPCSRHGGLRRQGEASSASGKQSGPNWSLTGLTCLHLLEETEDPTAWAYESCIGPRPFPSFISITTEKQVLQAGLTWQHDWVVWSGMFQCSEVKRAVLNAITFFLLCF